MKTLKLPSMPFLNLQNYLGNELQIQIGKWFEEQG